MNAPLALVSLAYAIGIAVAECTGCRPVLVVPLAALLALALAWTRWRGLLHEGMLALLLSLTLGMVAVAAALPRLPAGLDDGIAWAIDGFVASAPERTLRGVRLPIDVVAVERDGQRRTAELRLLMMLENSPPVSLLPGDRVRVTTTLRRPRGFINPGASDSALRAAADGIAAVGSAHAEALTRLAQPPRRSLERAVAAWRGRLLTLVHERLGHGEAAALVASLVLGDRGDIQPPLDDAFRAAGVSHVLSVSGLHLAIVGFLFYVGLRRLLLRLWPLSESHTVRPWAALAAMPAVVVYTLLTGAAVATVRSCLVALMWLGAAALSQRATALQALTIAALVILAASPLELFDPSFQLSFAAALGTTLLARRWSPTGPPPNGRLRRLGRWSWRLCAASAAAIAATAPIGAWHFAQLAPGGIVSNLVVVPLAEMGVVPVGLAGCLLTAMHLPGAGVLLAFAGLLARAMARFAIAFAQVWPAWHVPAPNVVEIVAWYTALLAIALRGRRALRMTLGCTVVLLAAAGWRVVARATSTTVRATFLDVGQGDAAVIELPHGRVMVVDGGGSFDPEFDPGQQVIAPFLWRRGIDHIDLMVLSHPHPDHANGLATLVDDFPVRELWTNGQETRQPGTVKLLAEAQRRGVRLGQPRPLDLGGAMVRPLAPLDDGGHVVTDAVRTENDNSLVVEIGWLDRRMLFLGDVEADGESQLLARAGPTLPADVVKVPHHGSKTSSTAALVAATHPQLAVISVGERNRWGFPNPGVLARWQGVGARVLRTDRDGGVTVTIDGHGRVAAATAR